MAANRARESLGKDMFGEPEAFQVGEFLAPAANRNAILFYIGKPTWTKNLENSFNEASICIGYWSGCDIPQKFLQASWKCGLIICIRR